MRSYICFYYTYKQKRIFLTVILRMFKPKDNDIFNTNSQVVHPKITNNYEIDPNHIFQQKASDNYDCYTAKLPAMRQTITKEFVNCGKVNENVCFDEKYHKNRKEKSLQSSIFYPPTQRMEQQAVGDENCSYFGNKSAVHNGHFGKKETMKREVNHLEINNGQIRGNSSRLFDMDQRISGNGKNQGGVPLIPHGMRWDQHDSIKYANINLKVEKEKEEVEEKKEIKIKEKVENEPLPEPEPTKTQEEPVQKKQKSAKSEQIEIKILKGWNQIFMEGLAKSCKLNKCNLISFSIDAPQKATIKLKRSPKWQNITDYLRKDCKLKIRVMH